MAKKLRAFTIIPPELYVPREADRQVRAILDDMGRPGYVLVARQMGKTNLILHARKQYAQEGDLFAYLDVSNRIPDVRSFFRNIVDVCCEQSIVAETDLGEKIRLHRATHDLLPHKEHEYELALICRNIAGRLIICLDEIDALIGTNYSDQIFSFIRSTYFAGRANHEEFQRLGYLLSGVAEPSDIIQNKDVSPFNIGAKIYLEDFTRDELSAFIAKSGLSLHKAVEDRLFEWTNGHPRMTWDIASALEDQTLSGKIPDLRAVDDLVRHLYFGEIDFPPVDQIKKLVLESKEIRESLISIHYNRTASITELTRAKLYLAGISRMDVVNKTIAFKNRILEEALSEQFVMNASPDVSKKVFDNVIHLFTASEFQRALFALESLDASSSNSEAFWLKQYWTARAKFGLGLYDEAIAALANSPPPNDVENFKAQSLIGTANLRSGKFDNALTPLKFCLDTSADWMPGCEHRLETSIDYACALIGASKKDLRAAETICKAVLSQQSTLLNSKGVYRSGTNVIVEANLCLAKIANEQSNIDLCRRQLETAESFAFGATKIRIALTHFDINKNPVNRRLLLEGCVQALKDVEQCVEAPQDSPHTIDVELIVQLLVALNKMGLSTNFQKVVSHLIEKLNEEELSKICTQIAGLAIQGGNRSISIQFLEGIITHPKSESLVAIKDTIGLLLSIDRAKIDVYGNAFLELFNNTTTELHAHNVYALMEVLVEKLKLQDKIYSKKALAILTSPTIDESELSDAESATLALVRDLGLTLFSLRDSSNSAPARARALVSRLKRASAPTLAFFPAEYFSNSAIQLVSLLAEMGVTLGKKEGRKIGRNQVVVVKYKNGPQKGKYKKFIGDLDMGLCELVEIGD